MQDLPLIRNSWKLLTHKCLFYFVFPFQSCRILAFSGLQFMLEHFSVLWSHKYQRALAGLEKKILLPVFPSREDEWKFCASNAKEIGT